MSQRNSINAIIYSRIGEGDKEQRRIVNRKHKVWWGKKIKTWKANGSEGKSIVLNERNILI